MIDFFQQQADARQRTKRLLLLFALAIVILTVLTVLCTIFFLPLLAFFIAGTGHYLTSDQSLPAYYLWLPALLVPTIILTASVYKSWQLSEGGARLATMMGGRLIKHPRNLREQQLLNVVEEMAVASGMKVPAVYVLDNEPAINAFTAGYRSQDMVIGMTKGCLKMLTRNELQGVVAHEFSHMLNGDTRLNTRMIGVLYGIDMVYLAGKKLINASFWEPKSTSSAHLGLSTESPVQRRSHGGGGHWVILLFAFCLIVIGGLGGFFATMIKTAICREREYLADAAAVQFTRNPNGITGALKKIGGYTWHSHMLFSNWAMVSHMLFSFDRNPRYEFSALTTHPPLEKRINRLEPNWNGEYIKFDAFDLAMMEDESEQPSYDPLKTAQVLGILATTTHQFLPPVNKQSEDLNNLKYAHKALRNTPQDWLACARNANVSCCVILTLLLSEEIEISRVQLQRIHQNNRYWMTQSELLLASRKAVGISSRLPLIEIALSRLAGHISTLDAYESFKRLMQDLIRADRQVQLFEWCIYTISIEHLKPICKPSSTPILPITMPKTALLDEYRRLFSLVAHFSHHSPNSEAAFQAACYRAELPAETDFDTTVRLSDLPRILHHLNQLPPLDKPELIHALVVIFRHGKYIISEERELLRAICLTLGSPQPPLG